VKAIKQQHPEAYSRLRGRYRFTEKCPPHPKRGGGGKKERRKRKESNYDIDKY